MGEFASNLFQYIGVIHANAFWAIVYFVSNNWFLLLAIGFIIYLMIEEININNEININDDRPIY
ncbi:MAG: hypothetical protein ACOCP4_01100 [Candidatus Woesearchaeota archaeon]